MRTRDFGKCPPGGILYGSILTHMCMPRGSTPKRGLKYQLTQRYKKEKKSGL